LATIVMAHLKASQTRRDRRERLQWKLSLTRQLYQQGYQRQDVINLFRFIDWLMSLPKTLEREFWREIRQFEEETRMPYLTSVERQGIEQGIEQGRQREGANLVLRQLNRRLGQVEERVEEQIRQLPVEQLEDLGEALLDFESEADLLHWLGNAT
jgi:predicted transposase YdaD